MIETFKNRIYLVLKFIGRRGLLWLSINLISGLLLGVIEIAVGSLLAVVLFSLGISTDLPLPGAISFFKSIPVQTMVFVFIFVGISRSLLQVLVNHSTTVSTNAINLRLQMLVFFDAFRIKQGAISTGKLNTMLSDYIGRATSFCHHAVLILGGAAQGIVMVGFMWQISVKYLLIGMAGVAVSAAIVYMGNDFIRKSVKSLPDAYLNINLSIKRTVQNILLLRALRTLSTEHQKLSLKVVSAAAVQTRSLFLARFIGVFPQIVGVFVVAGLIGLHMFFPDTPGVMLVSFLYIFIRLIQALGSIADNYNQMTLMFPYFKIMVKFYGIFPKDLLGPALENVRYLRAFGNSELIHFEESKFTQEAIETAAPPKVEFKNVTFSYNASLAPVISNLSFTVPAGGQIAITGPSGAGKSTILGLILGVYAPTSGDIKLDELRPSEAAAKENFFIGYVGAEPFLIEGSIRENLAYGLRHHKSDTELVAAMQRAQLGEWLSSNGLDYRITESGEGLSSGQKQRLSLARALLANPCLLILDEVSANLDSKTESEIAEVIKDLRGKCTTIIVSHREGLIRDIDLTLRLTPTGDQKA